MATLTNLLDGAGWLFALVGFLFYVGEARRLADA